MTTYINPMNDLAPALGNIAETVATVINPNYQFQKGVREMITKDPDMIRKLSSIEDNAPGSLEAMGFGKQLTSIIRKAPIPEKEMIEKLTRPEVEKAASNPKNANIRGTKEVTGQTPQQIDIADFQAALGQAGTKALQNPETANIAGTAQATGARPAQITTEQADAKTLEDAQSYIAQNPKQNLPDVVNGIFKGTIPMGVVQGLMRSPSGEAIKAYLGVEMQREQLSAQVQIANARNANELGDATYRMKYSRLLPTAIKLNVDPDSLIGFMDDAKVRARANELMNDPSKVKTDEDKRLVAMAQGLTRLNVADRHKMYRDTAMELVTLVEKQRKNQDKDGNDPGVRDALRGQIQEQLDLRHETLGAPELTVKYGKPPTNTKILGHTFGDEQFYYVNRKGDVVDSNVAQSFDPVVDPEVKKKVDIMYSNYLATPDSLKAAALEKIRRSDSTAYNAFRMLIDTADTSGTQP